LNPTYIERPGLITIALADRNQPSTSLRIEFHEAAATPVLGSASTQVGDVILSKEASGTSILLVSVGKSPAITPEIFRQAGGGLARWLLKSGVEAADLDLEPVFTRSQAHVSALLEGILLGAYQFNMYKNSEETPQSLSIFLRSVHSGIGALVEKVKKVCSAVNLARDWAHEPANVINPLSLAERVHALAEADGITVKIIDDVELGKMGAGGIIAVGKGSATPSRMIVMEYAGKDATPEDRPIILLGKAITFDTGGYSLKGTENIKGMKYDKCGGTTVAAMLHLVSQLKLRIPVIGIISAAENMVSRDSYRPDDIIHMLSGKTVEIISTDAEGRLVLADALAYAQINYRPLAMIDSRRVDVK
jgi:leucyl aminopeptidase